MISSILMSTVLAISSCPEGQRERAVLERPRDRIVLAVKVLAEVQSIKRAREFVGKVRSEKPMRQFFKTRKPVRRALGRLRR